MISLHLHTSWSMLDGYGLPEQYVTRCKEINQSGFAITDHGNIFAHRYFEPVAKKHGLKLVYGCEFYVRNTGEKYHHVTVLAKNLNGYTNLCRLVSISAQEDHFNKKPQITWGELRRHKQDLFILTGCFGDGVLHRLYQTNQEAVFGKALSLKRIFGESLFLEVQHTNLAELEYMRWIGEIAKIPVVATTDTHYPRNKDYLIQDCMCAIGTKDVMSNSKRFRLPQNLWMMSEEEALSFFTPAEVGMTDVIFDMCESYDLPKVKTLRLDDDSAILKRMVKERQGKVPATPPYATRIEYELSVIEKLGLHSYFIIMSDVIEYFKKKGVLIGPARGSAAGSVISYVLNITEVDPVKYELSFERFLDVNRKDYPDIDTDFPPAVREEVVDYLKDRYGRDCVGRISSFTTYRGGSVFWDLARIYGVDRSVAKDLGTAIPPLVNDEIGMTEIMEIPEVKNVCEKWPIFKQAVALEGQVRGLGQHASGYAIAPSSLSDICGVYRSHGELVLGVDKYTSESAGLIKLDILNLNTLDMLQEIIKEVGISNETLYHLQPTDPRVFDAFNLRQCAGVFQFEGAAVKEAIKSVTVESLEDLSFINAVARPGASNALRGIPVPEPVRKFIYRGKYFVYQEELMAILRWLEFSWDDVTKIRKMVSRKQVTKLDQDYKMFFIKQLSVHVSEAEASAFWETIKKCGEYMFNKSHSISYAMLAYWTMWLKINHHEVFVRAYLNHTDDDAKRREMLRECVTRGYGIRVLGKNPQFAVANAMIEGGLTSIKGIGPAKAKQIMGGKIDAAAKKAMDNAESDPVHYAPWSCLDNFNNKYKIGDLPEGEFMVKARVWEIKDGRCIIEDINGSEKAYFNPKFIRISEGHVYNFSITKFKYAKIDCAREI